MRHLRYLVGFAVLAILGCTQESAEPLNAVEAEMWQDEFPIRQPWLRDHLPDKALAYVRIPHILGLLAMPKGNALDPALRSKVNVENVEKVRQGIVDNVITLIPAFSEPNLSVLQYLRSPVEISATFLPAPRSLIAVNLDVDSNVAFDGVLDELGLSLVTPLDARNTGQIDGVGMPAYVQFDATSGRLLVNAGPGVTADSFAEMLGELNRNEPHRMQTMERQIDASGQGFFLWVDAQEAMSPMRMFVPREQLDTLLELGLGKVSSLALGWGAANGKSRIALVADVPIEDDRGFLPYVNNDLSAHSVGDPDGLFVVSIPTVEEFSRLEALVLETVSEKAKSEWVEGKELVSEAAGVTIEEVLGAIGPEVLLVFDKAGDYGAIRLRNPKLWNSVLTRIAAKTGSEPDQKRVAGNTYFHWSIPNQIEDMTADARADLGWMLELWGRQSDHVYWMRDGDFLYLASIPQPLYDRAALQPQTDIGEWLTKTQRIDASHAILSVSGTSRKLPKRLYGFYIDLLHALSDIAQADIDVWSMPSSEQLNLPQLGTMGFTLSLGNPTLAAEFTFENNPGEMFGGVGTVAVVGILAAIAIPAYQDYTIRAQVFSGISFATETKAAVAEYYLANDRFPGAAAAGQLSEPEHVGEYVSSITVEPDSGRIIVEYTDDVASTGGQLIFAPSLHEDGDIDWLCEGSLQNKHLPAHCRH